jgi:Protein of unknown function (DUF4236)
VAGRASRAAACRSGLGARGQKIGSAKQTVGAPNLQHLANPRVCLWCVMGFYIRKAVSVGPFRFNLSKSGVGLSVGVKGFRVGSGPRGHYVHMGRYGLYYRASLDNPSYRRTPEPSPQFVPTEPHTNNALTPVETGNVLDMVSTTGSSIVEQINKAMAHWSSWPWYSGAVWPFPRM